MDAGQDQSSEKQPRGQRVCDAGSIGEQRDDQEYAEDGQTFDTVGVRSGQPLHERRQIGVVRLELVCSDGLYQDEPCPQYLHQNEEKQRPGNQANQYDPGYVAHGRISSIVAVFWVAIKQAMTLTIRVCYAVFGPAPNVSDVPIPDMQEPPTGLGATFT